MKSNRCYTCLIGSITSPLATHLLREMGNERRVKLCSQNNNATNSSNANVSSTKITFRIKYRVLSEVLNVFLPIPLGASPYVYIIYHECLFVNICICDFAQNFGLDYPLMVLLSNALTIFVGRFSCGFIEPTSIVLHPNSLPARMSVRGLSPIIIASFGEIPTELR